MIKTTIGGMRTKIKAAEIAINAGVPVIITSLEALSREVKKSKKKQRKA